MLKKITGGIVSAAMLLTSLGSTFTPSAPVIAADSIPNYAEALQKSLYFYECQQAGPLPEWNRVEWRTDSTMIDEIPGGWYDAGDHVKFNLPMAYSASMLAWGLYQYSEGIETCGEMTNYVNNLTFVLDYLAACDQGDEIVYQVGNGQKDHTWWGPVELYEYGMTDQGNTYEAARETLKSSNGCSAVFGEMAAALAAGYCALEGRIDESTLSTYLDAAKHIYEVASTSPSDDVYNASDASGFYRSSHFYDELFYAANWLYIATGDEAYLEDATDLIPNLGTELGTSELKYSWVHCWDDVQQGGMLLYAMNTQDDFYISRVKKHVEYWAYASSDQKVSDGLLVYVSNWGCCRYAANAAFIAAAACDTVLADDSSVADYTEFYETQINYMLGENPNNQSYVVGFGENAPQNPHHRTAHSSWCNSVYEPETNRHTLYGALVGGPTQEGSYEDDRNNYINNEVATDYNAGYTALLCKMLSEYGGQSLDNFPEPEQHDTPEVYVEAKLSKASASGVDLSLKYTNHTAWPARVVDNFSYRYYMDITEVINAGYSASDVVIRCDRDQAAMYSGEGVAPAEVSQLIHYKDNIYYIEVTYPDGRAALPISEGRHQCELMLAIVFPNYGSGWDASNDFSNTGLSEEAVMAEYIPCYIDGVLYYGTEPDGTTADGGMTPQEGTTPAVTTTTAPPVTTVTTTTTAATTSAEPVTTTAPEPDTEPTTVPDDGIAYGDADCNGEVEIADVVAIMIHISTPGGTLTAAGINNADVYQRGDDIGNMDALSVQKSIAQLITELPESYMYM